MMDVIHSLDLENNTFLNILRKNEVKAQAEFAFKIMEMARVICYWCNSYERQFAIVCTEFHFGILAGRLW